jgi:hypothetical protein
MAGFEAIRVADTLIQVGHMADSIPPTLTPGRTGRQDRASSVRSCPKSAF